MEFSIGSPGCFGRNPESGLNLGGIIVVSSSVQPFLGLIGYKSPEHINLPRLRLVLKVCNSSSIRPSLAVGVHDRVVWNLLAGLDNGQG